MGNKIKILAIDDNRDNLITLKALIKDSFPDVLTLTATNGETGLIMASEEDPDIILLDIVMPVMDGFEFCEKLKADGRLSDIPVVFITAQKGDKESRIHALEVGADAFLAKPIDENELIAQIRAMLKIKSANTEKRNEKRLLAQMVKEQTSELKRAHLATLNLLEDLKAEIETRKENEDALRKSEENMADIFQTVTEGIGYASLTGELIAVNSALEKIVEIPKEQLVGMNIMVLIKKFLSFENTKKTFTVLNKLILGKNIENFSLSYKDKILEFSATINKKSRRITGVIRDITIRNQAEDELRKSEERFRTLIENAFDGIYLTNGKNFYYVNSKFCEIIGYSANELISPDFNFDVTLTDESNKAVHERSILRKMNKSVPGTYEIQVKTKGGSYKILEISTVNLGKGKDLNVMGIVRDITERRKIEAKIIQSERLSALGEMSAGMAHEINQPLNTLSILFDNILLEAKNKHSLDVEYLALKTGKVFDNILRIRNLIDHVREFSRSHDGYILNSFNINDSILNALSMVSEQSKIAGINIITSFEKKLPLIKGNTFKFEQVILNFISNSRDALLEKKNHLDKPYPMFIKIKSRFDNRFIFLEVEDNGIGIKEENIDKILQPFFTTKETGKGTGLGLSISYGLIQEIHGKIAIKSKIMVGTTILVTIPLVP